MTTTADAITRGMMINSGQRATNLFRSSLMIVLIALGAAGGTSPSLANGSGVQPRPAHSSRFREVEEHAKRDSQAVGAAVRHAAQRVGATAQAVGHSVAVATRRAVAKTRAALKHEDA